MAPLTNSSPLGSLVLRTDVFSHLNQDQTYAHRSTTTLSIRCHDRYSRDRMAVSLRRLSNSLLPAVKSTTACMRSLFNPTGLLDHLLHTGARAEYRKLYFITRQQGDTLEFLVWFRHRFWTTYYWTSLKRRSLSLNVQSTMLTYFQCVITSAHRWTNTLFENSDTVRRSM